jgi:hypothetical protein
MVEFLNSAAGCFINKTKPNKLKLGSANTGYDALCHAYGIHFIMGNAQISAFGAQCVNQG